MTTTQSTVFQYLVMTVGEFLQAVPQLLKECFGGHGLLVPHPNRTGDSGGGLGGCSGFREDALDGGAPGS